MKIQVNSDKTIDVNAKLIRFVDDEVRRVLGKFDSKLSRVEIHLSDVDAKKTGKMDKRCLVEVRPLGDRPRSASAKSAKLETAIGEALGKTQRALTTFFGRKGRTATSVSSTKETSDELAGIDTALAADDDAATQEGTAPKQSREKKPTKLSPRGPKKKLIYQARRKSPTAR